MRIFWSKTWKGILLSVLFVLLIPFSSIQAQNTCQCFCTGVGGVTDEGQATPTDCSNLCNNKSEQMSVCASSPASYPANSNIRCFTDTACAKQNGVWDANQARDCVTGSHYCYAAETPVDLSISISGTKTVNNIGQYINLIYIFLLGASIAIAIVMLMIGGLQYTLGAASPAQIEKAKERIRNAVIGLVLLILATLLLETVNPQLKKLNPPQFPVIRRIELLGDESCETLIKDKGYKIEESSITQGKLGKKMCSSVAVVLETGDGNKVPAGTTCTFEKCPNSADECFGQGENASCVSCQAVVGGNPFNIKPSTDNCSSLQKPDRIVVQNNVAQIVTKNYCFWTREADLAINGIAYIPIAVPITAPILLATGVVSAEDVESIFTGTCAEMQIDCNRITSCRDYDDVIARNSIENVCLDDIDPLFGGDLTLGDVCIDDPCGVAPAGQTCGMYEIPGVTDCTNSVFIQKMSSVSVPSDWTREKINQISGIQDNDILKSIINGAVSVDAIGPDAAVFIAQYVFNLQYAMSKDGTIDKSPETCHLQ